MSTVLTPTSRRSLAPRVLVRVETDPAAPTLVCVAGLHGNEGAGVRGVERVAAALEGASDLAGNFVGLVGNRRALAVGRRFVDLDLNRIWTPDRVAQLIAGREPTASEEEELLELHRELRELLAWARGPVFVLDLHTVSGQGPAFAILDDDLPNRAFARHFPVPLVLGLEEELEGTLLHWPPLERVTCLGFEAGQHEDPASVDRAAAAVWIALRASGVLPAGRRPEPAVAERLLEAGDGPLPAVFEVRYRHPLAASEGFVMAPGFHSFQPVVRGQELARNRHGAVTASESALVLMPLYQPQGEEGFYLVRRVRSAWLEVSALVRRLRLERFLHLLPGVRRHPELTGAFIVDQKVARWMALELFHLLGFRRRGARGRVLVLCRRRDRP